jgi:hypothetical protein
MSAYNYARLAPLTEAHSRTAEVAFSSSSAAAAAKYNLDNGLIKACGHQFRKL